MQDKNSPNQLVGRDIFGRWQHVALVWQYVALLTRKSDKSYCFLSDSYKYTNFVV
ncbi:MAG: hypothetical protein VB024_02385 [Dysgonamonadaceae bacterium]|jgi:hypothetical protein|nr:hypothetical protein [Dysgonamonadaceae bacterium]